MIEKCAECNGNGMKMEQSASPMGIMIRQSECTACSGSGKIIRENCKCSECKGLRTIEKMVELKITVPKGGDYSNTIIENKGNYDPQSRERGHLLLQLRPKGESECDSYSKEYTRNGNDLYKTLDITLKQALLGFTTELQHFEQPLKISSEKVIKPNFVKVIYGVE